VQELNSEIVTKLGNKINTFLFILGFRLSSFRKSATVGHVVPTPDDDGDDDDGGDDDYEYGAVYGMVVGRRNQSTW
jgi:hypothetical protein